MKNESHQHLDELVQLGVDSGYWTVVKRSDEDNTVTRWASVKTTSGHSFWLSAGGWRHEGKITAHIDKVSAESGISISTRDVLRYDQQAPEATVSSDRGASVILKTLQRRIFENKDVLAISTKMLETLAEREAQRASLHKHIEQLKEKGVNFRSIHGTESYSASGYAKGGNGFYEVTIYSSGALIVKSVDILIEQFDALLQLTKKVDA